MAVQSEYVESMLFHFNCCAKFFTITLVALLYIICNEGQLFNASCIYS